MEKRVTVIVAALCGLLGTAGMAFGDICVWSGSGEASDGANWVGRAEPQAGDDVVFDGTSTAACVWNLELELGSWTQTIAYSGKVTVPVSESMLFKVTGDIAVHGGELVFAGDTTAIGDGTAEEPFGVGYTLEAANIVIGANGNINADGQGFGARSGPGAGDIIGNGHYRGGGYGGNAALRNNVSGKGAPYGTPAMPTALGSGAGSTTSGAGGGALKLSALNTIVDGTLSADGADGPENHIFGGSGGSIWIVSGTLQGEGVIAARGGMNKSGWCGSGGGRIDISGVVNNFTGDIIVSRNNGIPASSSFRSSMAGSVLLPVSSGSGLTMANMVISNELWIGNAQAFGSVTVTNGGTLYLGANVGEDDFYFSSLNIHSKTAYSRNQMLYSIEILFS